VGDDDDDDDSVFVECSTFPRNGSFNDSLSLRREPRPAKGTTTNQQARNVDSECDPWGVGDDEEPLLTWPSGAEVPSKLHRTRVPLVRLLGSFSLLHDAVFGIFILVSLVGDAQGWWLHPVEHSTFAFAQVVSIWLRWCVVFVGVSNSALTIMLIVALREKEEESSISVMLYCLATMTCLGISTLVLVPRCMIAGHKQAKLVAIICSTMYHLVLIVLHQGRLSPILFPIQLIPALACWLYFNTDSYWFLLSEALAIVSFQKFLTSVLRPALPDASQPKITVWAAVVVPTTIALMSLNSALGGVCPQLEFSLSTMTNMTLAVGHHGIV